MPRILDPTGRVWDAELSRFYADKLELSRPEGRNEVEKHLFSAKRGREAWRIGVISKMFAVAREDLPTETGRGANNSQEEKTEQREDVRNLSVEERRRRAKEARDRHEAARKAKEGAAQDILQKDATAVQLAASGGVADGQTVDKVAMPAELPSSFKADGNEANEVPTTSLGTASAVPIDATYERQAPSMIAEAQDSREDANGAEKEDQSEVLLAFVRVYSGSLTPTTTAEASPFFLLLPKFNPALPADHPSNAKHIKRIHIQALYVIMGKELVRVKEAQAGEICAVQGLEGIVGRMGTIVALPQASLPPAVSLPSEAELVKQTSPGFVNLTGGAGLAAPIVRVALEPDNPSDLPKLIEGLRLLNQSDPCVQTLVQETGEHVIVTAGELHLERCLKDLRERFARVPITPSKPLVPFRETAVRVSEMAPPRFGAEGEPRGTVNISIASGAVKVKVRAKPLPLAVTEWLEANTATIRTLLERRLAGAKLSAGDDEVAASGGASATGAAVKQVPPSQFFPTLASLLQKAGSSARAWEQEWKEEDLVDRIWSFGPRRVGPNLLIGAREGAASRAGIKSRIMAKVGGSAAGSGLATPRPNADTAADQDEGSSSVQQLGDALAKATLEDGEGEGPAAPTSGGGATWTVKDLVDSLDTGFQMATLAGPMCAEPVRGLAYFLEDIQVDEGEVARSRLRLSQVTGSLISSMREACRSGLQDWSPRLMLAMYECDVQASPEVLGKVHAVLSRRRGRVTSEEMRDGTAYFTVGATLPVVESFGFADEVRKRTSGLASPQLVFKGFEMFDLDPYWVPRTEEELEDLGEKGERENVAKRYMDAVRRRKGMRVEGEKVVENAEKQRNLKSN